MRTLGRFLKRIGKSVIILSSLYLARLIVTFFIFSSSADSIGIIGGADGPTAIFLAGKLWKYPAFAVYLIIIGIALVIIGNKIIKSSDDDENN